MQPTLFPVGEVVSVRVVRREVHHSRRQETPQRGLFDARWLFDTHVAWALAIAARRHRKLPLQVRLEEVEAAALEGLWLAARRYDFAAPRAGFRTFAGCRVNGAILDYLRSLDWWSRRRLRAHGLEMPGRVDWEEVVEAI